MNLNKKVIMVAPDSWRSGKTLTVNIDPDYEEVVWTWATYPNGERHVTGYTIVPKQSDKPEEADYN